MKKKSFLIILLVACMIFSVSGVVASDVNDALANDGNDTSLASDENDFVVSNDIDDMKASSRVKEECMALGQFRKKTS